MKIDPFNVEAKKEPSGCTSYTLYQPPVVQNLNRYGLSNDLSSKYVLDNEKDQVSSSQTIQQIAPSTC